MKIPVMGVSSGEKDSRREKEDEKQTNHGEWATNEKINFLFT